MKLGKSKWLKFLGLSCLLSASTYLMLGYANPIAYAATTNTSPASNGLSMPVIDGNSLISKAFSVNRSSLGVNVGTWDGAMLAPSTPHALDKLGIGYEQFPNAELWSWKTDRSHTKSPAGTGSWETYKQPFSLDKWGQMLIKTHESGLYIVNFAANPSWTHGGTVKDAVAVTKYILKHHYPVHAMAIGSEEFGTWNYSLQPTRNPVYYANLAKKMAIAIHKIDPTMQIGVDYPVGNTAKWKAWDKAVLQIDSPYVQFLSVHIYLDAKPLSNSGLVSSMTKVLPILRNIKSSIHQYAAGTARQSLQTWVTEFNPYSIPPTHQSEEPVYGAAMAEGLLWMYSSGVKQVDPWVLHIGDHKSQGSTGTSGILSAGVGQQPAVNTMFASGKAMAEIANAVTHGATVQSSLENGIFVSQVKNGTKDTLFLINNRSSKAQITVNGTSVHLNPAQLKVMQGPSFSVSYSNKAYVGFADAMGRYFPVSDKPDIKNISPRKVSPGMVVTVRGQNFGASDLGGYLHLDDIGVNWGEPLNCAKFKILSWSDTEIKFIAPEPSGGHGMFKMTANTTATIRIHSATGQKSNVVRLQVN